MSEVLLLWLFVSCALVVACVVALLALGALFGLLWLAWKGVRLCARALSDLFRLSGRKVDDDVRATFETIDTRLPRRLRRPDPARAVRVQAGLVPAPACVARGHHVGVERSAQSGPPPRHG